jgi:hypothetical protein
VDLVADVCANLHLPRLGYAEVLVRAFEEGKQGNRDWDKVRVRGCACCS